MWNKGIASVHLTSWLNQPSDLKCSKINLAGRQEKCIFYNWLPQHKVFVGIPSNRKETIFEVALRANYKEKKIEKEP